MLINSVSTINYFWRVIATGISFITFGIGGLVISQMVFPIICLTTTNKNKRHQRAQKLIHVSFRCHIAFTKLLGVMSTEVVGKEKLTSNKVQLFLANHPTLLDVVLIMSLVPRSNCIVKGALFRNPFLRGVVLAAGYVNNGSAPQQLINDCVLSLERENSLIIFPEGTRSPSGKRMKFQRAPARIAIEKDIDITPIVITCTPSALTKGLKWYQIPKRRFHLRLEVGELIKVKTIISAEDVPSLSVRKLTRYLENYFEKEILRYEQS